MTTANKKLGIKDTLVSVPEELVKKPDGVPLINIEKRTIDMH
jgi:hypothetical protein